MAFFPSQTLEVADSWTRKGENTHFFYGPRRLMLLNFTAQYFTYGPPMGHLPLLDLLSSVFVLPPWDEFPLRRTTAPSSAETRADAWRFSGILGGNVLPICSLLAMRSNVPGATFSFMPYCVSVSGLDTLRWHELIGFSSEDSNLRSLLYALCRA